jgi:ABC-type Fe3+-hydroxamate transport system substrate-binding protein
MRSRQRDFVVLPMLPLALMLPMMIVSCATTAPIERSPTMTASVPVSVACVKPEDIPPLPPRTVVVEPASTDQLAAAAAADRENYIRYADAVAKLLAQCSAVKGK